MPAGPGPSAARGLGAATVIVTVLAVVAWLTPAAVSAAPVAPAVDVAAIQAPASGDVVLAWTPVDGATSYKVEVSSSSSFAGTALYTATTGALRATPTAPLPNGTVYWRVAAVDASGQGNWTTSSFERNPIAGPGLLSPGVGSPETLDYPTDPPVLAWSPVPGAKDYAVEWSTNDLFPQGGTTTVTTGATRYAIPALLDRGPTWHWRVRGNLSSNGLTTEWSGTGQFVIQWPSSAPQLLGPAHDPGGATPVTDIALRWSAVQGATSYRVYVATDPDFAAQLPNSPFPVKSTRYSPARSWDNAAYFWKVTAVDPTGNEGPPSEVRQMTRAWGPTSADTMSQGQRIAAPAVLAPASGSTVSIDDFRLSWTAVPRASFYEVWITPEESNFFTDGSKILKCRTPHTSITHLSAYRSLSSGSWARFPSGATSGRSSCDGSLGTSTWPYGTNFRWRVRAVDLAASDAQSQQGSDNVDQLQRYIRSAWSDRDTAADPAAVVVTNDHSGAAAGLTPTLTAPDDCTDPLTCVSEPDTPELVWTPVAGATAGYWLEIALDPAFTNKVAEFHTYSARFRMDGSLLDNVANQAYYWRVMGCSSFTSLDTKSCLPNGVANQRAFRKVGKSPVALTSSVSGDQVTFGWDEQLATAPNGGGTRGYEVQIATDQLFSQNQIVYTAKVDQPFATTSDDLLTDGAYYWRVRALDGVAATLPWSAASTFSKSAPKPTQDDAVSGPTAPALAWQAVPGSASYDLEIYNGGNLSAGGSRLLIQQGIRSATRDRRRQCEPSRERGVLRRPTAWLRVSESRLRSRSSHPMALRSRVTRFGSSGVRCLGRPPTSCG